MKKHIILMIIFTCAVFAAANVFAGEMSETMSKARLIGSSVQNTQGNDLGTISDVSLDNEGNIRFAVLKYGGFMGIGEKLIPIPVNAISFKDEKLAVVNISEEKLKTAPSISKEKGVDISNRAWVEETSRFYGVRPYWDESGVEHQMKEMKEMKPMEELEEIEEPTHEMQEEIQE